MNLIKLQAEFSNWIETLAYRTRSNYLRGENRHAGIIAIDELSEDRLEQEEFHVAFDFSIDGDFNFENAWLEKAFSQLTDSCKEILKMMFIEGKNTTEIAAHFNCSIRYINKQKAKAFELIKQYEEKK